MTTSGAKTGENPAFPALRQVVLDTTDARGLAEFYRELLGFAYLPGDEPPPPGAVDKHGADWLVLLDRTGARRLAFQQVESLAASSWPTPAVPQQLHLDLSVATIQELDRQHARALALGACVLQDRSQDEDEPLRVYADPAGHPFCIFLVAESEGGG